MRPAGGTRWLTTMGRRAPWTCGWTGPSGCCPPAPQASGGRAGADGCGWGPHLPSAAVRKQQLEALGRSSKLPLRWPAHVASLPSHPFRPFPPLACAPVDRERLEAAEAHHRAHGRRRAGDDSDPDFEVVRWLLLYAVVGVQAVVGMCMLLCLYPGKGCGTADGALDCARTLRAGSRAAGPPTLPMSLLWVAYQRACILRASCPILAAHTPLCCSSNTGRGASRAAPLRCRRHPRRWPPPQQRCSPGRWRKAWRPAWRTPACSPCATSTCGPCGTLAG